MNKNKIMCVCSHTKEEHRRCVTNSGGTVYLKASHYPCVSCWLIGKIPSANYCTGFKLDNLSYMEQLAKEKNLI